MEKQEIEETDPDITYYTKSNDEREDAFRAGRDQMRKEVISMIQRMIECFHGMPDEPQLDFNTATSIQARVGRL